MQSQANIGKQEEKTPSGSTVPCLPRLKLRGHIHKFVTACNSCCVYAGLGLATVPLVFSYLEMLRQAGPQCWVFKELAAVSEQRFRFAEDEEASEYVSRLAASLPLYAPEHALNGSYVHDEWRPDLVSHPEHIHPET